MTDVSRILTKLKSWLVSLCLSAGIPSQAREKFLASLKQLCLHISVLIILFLFIVYGIPFTRELLIPAAQRTTANKSITEDDKTFKSEISSLRRELSVTERRLEAFTPSQYYLIINTTENRFYVFRHIVKTREGFCSSGSFIHLKTHDKREWIFRTPRGLFRIQGKIIYPVWKKPDWAFLEEGLPVPPPDHYSRFEYGALGDYALDLGNGYLIHGTLYQRSLGMPVTHGCVRLNDSDLAYVYNSLDIGSKVFIF